MAIEANRFRAIVETHQRTVFSIALRVTGVFETAEEVAQDVFLELYRTTPRLEGEEHLRAWLRRVSVHRSTDALRRRGRQPAEAAEEFDELAPGVDPGSGGSALGMEARLESLIDSLPEAQRIAVVLRFTEEMWPEEIAALLGQPLATVKSNLQRGLALLRRKAGITLKEFVREQA